MSYYDKPVAVIRNKVSCEEFEKAWVIWEKNSGSLRSRRIRLAVCGCLFLFILMILPSYRSSYSTVFLPVIGLLMLLLAVIYLLFIKLRMVSEEAERMYLSNSLLGIEEQITLTKEQFQIVSEYEKIQGYWSEMSLCIETGECFVVTGGREHPLLILSKSCMTQEEKETVSIHMQNTFASRYQKREA